MGGLIGAVLIAYGISQMGQGLYSARLCIVIVAAGGSLFSLHLPPSCMTLNQAARFEGLPQFSRIMEIDFRCVHALILRGSFKEGQHN